MKYPIIFFDQYLYYKRKSFSFSEPLYQNFYSVILCIACACDINKENNKEKKHGNDTM